MKLRLLAFGLALSVCMSACGSNTPQTGINPDDIVISSTVEVADPEAALDKIYETVDIMDVSEASDRDLRDQFYLDTDLLAEYYVRFASGRFGVADVFILKPQEGLDAEETQQIQAQVREQLEQVKINREKQFENYDIYNAYQIAQEAPIYGQGGYLVMLMLEDTDHAREIIDQYIPKS